MRCCKPMNHPFSPSMGWTEHTLKYYAEINHTRKKFWTRISCVLRFKTVWEIIQCCLTSKGQKKIRPCGFAHFIRCKDYKRRGNYAESIVHAMICHDIHMEFI